MPASRTTGRGPAARATRSSLVLEAARDLAREGGYEAVQMREVAKRARVVLATLYRYYSSKDDLIRALTDEELATLDEYFRVSPPRHSTAHARANAVVMRVFRAFEANTGFAHAAMTCYHTPRPWAEDRPAELAATSPTFVEIVGRAAWGPDHRPTKDQRVSLQILESVLSSSVIEWLDGSISASDAEHRIRFAAKHLVTS